MSQLEFAISYLGFLSFTLRAMRRHIHTARDFILPVIDFFYPPFRRIMNLQTFRYAASGGGNVLLGFLIYFISYKYLFHERDFHFHFFAFKSHVAALFISFLVTQERNTLLFPHGQGDTEIRYHAVHEPAAAAGYSADVGITTEFSQGSGAHRH